MYTDLVLPQRNLVKLLHLAFLVILKDFKLYQSILQIQVLLLPYCCFKNSNSRPIKYPIIFLNISFMTESDPDKSHNKIVRIKK